MIYPGINLAFDIYPEGLPRSGALLVRLLAHADFLEGTEARVSLRGTGSGLIVLPANHAAVLAGYLADGNYVRVVDLDLNKVVAGFFLESGSQKVLGTNEQGVELLQFGGPGTKAYVGRGTFPHILHSLVDESFEEHQTYIYNTGRLRFSGPETYGGVLGRVLYEERLDVPSMVPDLPAHTWDDVVDSGDTPWTVFDDYFDVTCGDNVLDIATELAQQGIDWMLHPHTFIPSAYLAGTYGTDRTSSTFAAGKVRFERAVNIDADLDRTLNHVPYVSHMMVIGDDGTTFIRVQDLDWVDGMPRRAGTLRLDTTHDQLVMEEAGKEAIRLRKIKADQATFPHHPGDDPEAGLYRPSLPGDGGDYWLGDLVTLHTGTDPHQYNEQAIQVAAITWRMRPTGDFDPIVELGAAYFSQSAISQSQALAGIVSGHTHPPNPTLCDAMVPPAELAAPDRLLYSPAGSFTDGDAAVVQDGNDTTYLIAKIRGSGGQVYMAWAAPVELTGYTMKQGFHPSDPNFGNTALVRAGWRVEYSDDDIGDDSGVGTWTEAENAEGSAGVQDSTHSLSAGAHKRWRWRSTTWDGGGALQTDWVIRTLEVEGDTAAINPLNGTSTRARRCDSTEHEILPRDPTVNDDETTGYPRRTIWHNETSGATFISTDDSDGAAVWAALVGGLSEAEVQTLIDAHAVAGDPHPAYETATEVAAAISAALASLSASDLSTHYEPMLDSAGMVMVDSAGLDHMQEVAH